MIQRQSSWMAKGTVVALLGLAGGMTQAQAAGITYKIVPAQSKFTVWSKTTSPLANLRHTRQQHTSNYSGSVVFSAPNKPASVTMSVKADSLTTVIEHDLTTGTAARVDMVTKRDILQSDQYPTITFKGNASSVKVGAGGAVSGTLKGTLSLHGVTKAVSVPISGKVTGDTVNAKGSFSINQSDYGITLISIMGGMLAAQDPVTIEFNLVAKK